jgi:hypothetical protein
MADPPVLAGAVKDTEAEPFPAVAAPMMGAPGAVAYVRASGFVSEPLLLGVRVTGPGAVGVMVKVWGVAELLKVSTTGVDSPPPEGINVIVPV